MVIIEDVAQLSYIDKSVIITPVYDKDLLLYLYLYEIKFKQSYIVPINTFDCINIKYSVIKDFISDLELIVITNKKKFIKYFSNNNIIDINVVIMYEAMFDILVDKNISKNIPTLKYFDNILENCKIIHEIYVNYFTEKEKYTLYNEIFINACDVIEQNKIFYDNNFHVFIYNIYNNTSRLSGTGNVNFISMGKHSDEKNKITSRFGNNGILLSLDYEACAVNICAEMIGFKFPEYPYEYFSKLIFNDSEHIKDIKNSMFSILFGTAEIDLDFFKKVSSFSEKLYNYYKEHGYILSPFGKKPIYPKDENNVSKGVLLNYFTQSYEAELIVSNIYKLNKIIEENNFKSKVVLYIYDSILIDFNLEDEELLNYIKETFEVRNFKIKLKYGINYNNMKLIN